MTSGQHDFPTETSSQSAFFQRPGVAAICLVVLVASTIVTPMCFLGNASGHDFQPHVASWVEASSQWHQGIVSPRWAAGANSAYGEPRFIFYPPASWMFGAALGSILPWRSVPGAFVWLTLLMAGMSMWQLAREWLSPTQAIAAALFFTASPYHLALIYYRSDFAELLASALFPLMLFGVCGLFGRGWRRIPVVAFSFAGIWLANAPAGVIATYSLPLMLLTGCIVARKIRPLIFGAVGMATGFGVAAFYLVPAWWEQRWVQIGKTMAETFNPESNFLFTHANDPEFLKFNWKISALALTIAVLASIAIALSFKRRSKWPHVWWMLLLLSIASAALMLPMSALLWRHLPELRFLQFPWRWLLALNLALAFFAAAAGAGKRRAAWWIVMVCAIFATGATIAGDTSWDSEDVPSLLGDISAGRGYDGIEGFQPTASNTEELDDESPLVGEVDPESNEIGPPENVQVTVQTWSAETKTFSAKSDEPVTLGLRLLNYPPWQAQVDGRSITAETSSQAGQVLVPLTAGTHQVELRFVRTRDRTIGILISLTFCLGLSVVIIFALRKPALTAHCG